MGIRGLAAANQARLFGHEPDMIAVAQPARLREIENALIDLIGCPRASRLVGCTGLCLIERDRLGRMLLPLRWISMLGQIGCLYWECCQSSGEGLVHLLRVSGR